jgi:hypothetical protein
MKIFKKFKPFACDYHGENGGAPIRECDRCGLEYIGQNK